MQIKPRYLLVVIRHIADETFEEIGKDMGVSRQRVQQMNKLGLEWLNDKPNLRNKILDIAVNYEADKLINKTSLNKDYTPL